MLSIYDPDHSLVEHGYSQANLSKKQVWSLNANQLKIDWHFIFLIHGVIRYTETSSATVRGKTILKSKVSAIY